MTSIKNQWQKAYEKAEFYKSPQNTVEYWDRVAGSGSSGIAGNEKCLFLLEILEKYGLSASSVLDVGCGTGDYTIALAPFVKSVTALDNSQKMLEVCKTRVEKEQFTNVEYLNQDFFTLGDEKYDFVISCLNPATYNPVAFDKMLSICGKCLVYFSSASPIDSEMNEPVYCSTNSIYYAYEYLRELGFNPEIHPFNYDFTKPDGSIVTIPFAYVLCKVGI